MKFSCIYVCFCVSYSVDVDDDEPKNVTFKHISSVWPDLAKFRYLGMILEVLGKILSVYFVFGKNFTYFGIKNLHMDHFSLL